MEGIEEVSWIFTGMEIRGIEYRLSGRLAYRLVYE